MHLQAVYCFIFIMAAKWHGEASHLYENRRSLSSREIDSQYRCCRGNNYNGYTNFNRRHDFNPSYNKQRYEYHTHSSIHNNYPGDKYFRPNHDFKSPPSKYISPKDYYPRRYNGPSHPGSKFIQNRVGFAFPDTHNVKEGNGGYRPYVPNPDFALQSYYNRDFGYDGYRKKNDFTTQYDRQEKKYRPGLLQSVSVGNSGIVFATGLNGYKHVIHDLPPWIDLNSIPERDNFNVRFPGNLDQRGGTEYDEPHRFSHGFNKRPSDFNHPYSIQGNPIYTERNPFDGEEPPNSIKDLYGNKNGPPKDVPDITYQPHNYKEHKPSKSNEFRPSPTFHRYSEPDPLYHPSGSPLLTHSTTKSIEIPTTKPTPRSAAEISSKYPDSINAQLPPPTLNTDTRVPYVAATEVTQNAPEQFTVVTQASDATDKKSLIKILPTDASALNYTSFTIVQETLKPDKIKVVLPTKLYVEKKEENTKSDDIKKFLTKIPVLPTQIYSHNFTPDKKSSVIKKDMSKSDEIKAILSNVSVLDSLKDSSFNIAIKEQKPVSPSSTLIPIVEISTRTEIFLPTVITEKYPAIQESEMKSQAEPTLQSSKVNSEISNSSNTNQEGNKDKIKKPLISINEFSKQTEVSESIIQATPSETTTVKTETTLFRNTTNDNNLMSGHVDLKQTVENSDEKTTLPVLIESTTEKMALTTIDSLFPATRLGEEIQVKDRVSTLLDQIHNLINHARSLDYLQYEAITTIAPLQDSDW